MTQSNGLAQPVVHSPRQSHDTAHVICTTDSLFVSTLRIFVFIHPRYINPGLVRCLDYELNYDRLTSPF